MENFIDFEEQLNKSIDLLEIARDYCEFNNDKDTTICNLISLIDIILQSQKNLMAKFDKVMIN